MRRSVCSQGKGQRSFQRKQIDAGRKEKELRETGRKERVDPHWHGKTYGLEVDPWSAVETVRFFCAVSLS